MRRLSLLFVLTALFAVSASAQNRESELTGNDKFSIKVQPFFGSYLDKNNHHFEKLGLERLSGMNLGIEFPSDQQRPWQQYLNNSTLGIGLSA